VIEMVIRRKKKEKRTPDVIRKQDEYVAQLVALTQSRAPCCKLCNDCKCKVNHDIGGTACVHSIIRHVIGDLVAQ